MFSHSALARPLKGQGELAKDFAVGEELSFAGGREIRQN
jgi:hypothetical protein